MCKNSFDLVVTVRGGVQVTFFVDSFGRTVGSRELKLVSRVPRIAFLFNFAAAFVSLGISGLWIEALTPHIVKVSLLFVYSSIVS
jgi:hypothetical protein